MESIPSNLDTKITVQQAVSRTPRNASPQPREGAVEEASETRRSAQAEQIREQRQARKAEREQAPQRSESEGLQPSNRSIHFKVHREAERIFIEIVDRDTGEVVKQIPPDQLLKLAESLRQATGNLLDESA